MILDFRGGVPPLSRTLCGKKDIEYSDNCSAVCISAGGDAEISVSVGSPVMRGSLIGQTDKTPVYSPIAGVFRGILDIEGGRYFTVINNGESGENKLFAPESSALTEMDSEYIIDTARRLAVYDSRSGLPLWRLLEKAAECRRLVIDCTERDPAAAISYRLCIEKARSAVGGAKVILHCIGALKCVFAAEHYRKAAFASLERFASDEKLFAFGRLEEKYPYSDRTLMDALYLKDLAKGETALDNGVLIVGIEAAAALYDAMASGLPQLDRYISVCGSGISEEKNLCVPRGITLHDIIGNCGGLLKENILVENSLICGNIVVGALGDGTVCLVAVRPEKRQRVACIGCGRCAEACPVRLIPSEVLSGKGKTLSELCVACGACEFICPSSIPLLELIGNRKNNKRVVPEGKSGLRASDDDNPEVLL